MEMVKKILNKSCKQNSCYPFTKVSLIRPRTLLDHSNVLQKRLRQILSWLDIKTITARFTISFTLEVFTGRMDQQTYKKSHFSTDHERQSIDFC